MAATSRDASPPEHLRVDVEPVRLLDQDGRRTEDPRFPLDMGAEGVRRLHRLMARTRGLNAQAIALQRQGELGLHLSCRGQEAAQVGSASALGPDDWVFPQGRELGVAVARGLDPAEILQVWRGTWFTGHDVRATRFAPYTMPIATQLPHAVGVAMAARTAGAADVAVAYVGDGGTSEGDFHEALTFAGVFEAPCVVVVQNNGWSISVPLHRQTRAPTLAHKAVGYGVPAVRVDGQDVLACHAVTRWAVERARRGGGPVLVEAVTYRLDGHSTSDDPSRYQPADEIARWEALDPLERTRRHLERTGAWDDAFGEEVETEVREARDALRASIVGSRPPAPDEMFAHVYVDPPPALAEQRAFLAGELARRPPDRTRGLPG